ncbi:hypothetical protein K7402_23285 [Pseudomonas fluorescens group sp.]|uniref:Uncharacterized protein n=2 Tax=Pseudomonas fluorescens TaxID=294 RepID=C3K0B1_PSEFS|nr:MULTISPECIES: hypothetical protein [Pseudomonas fluorescens group]MBZ6455125.1 hypothetical protein [Pseudomonas fluorescens group sp.]MBZ6463682.1 hypothetical protein [Pseudomonas fluorescens group sp.]MBZ6470322.1 hypothetical protein [Pseudomonas fluorescens group sp.]WQD70855.1 hypothetical protein U0037_22780 [Pseudomonas marginalis]CAI2798717.1 Uncharacterized protein PFLU_4545 [Pseudomonas fluorescens SBW25]
MPLPIDRYANSSANNYSDRYATKHQDVAPQPHSTQSSWMQGSSNTGASAPLLDKQPYSAMSPSRQKELDQLKKTKDALEKLPVDFPTPALPKTSYQPPINLLEQRIKKLEVSPGSKNPINQFNDYRENKKTDKAFNKEMGSLYKQARDVQTRGSNPTDRNRASNVTDTLTTLGKGQPWLKDIRKENRKEGA